MSNIVISPQSGVIEFNNNSPSGAAIGSATAPIRLDATGGNSFITGGNLGVGMTAPLSALHVYGDGGTAARIDNGALRIRYPGNNDAITITPSVGNEGRILASDPDTASPHPLKIAGDYVRITTSGNAAATEVARFTADGRLGIGVNDPDATLEVKGAGNGSATTSLHVRDSDNQKLFMVRNDGVVTVEHNYFYASASAGAYVQHALRVRGSLFNDQGSINIGSSNGTSFTGPVFFGNSDAVNFSGAVDFTNMPTISGNSFITGFAEGDTLQTVTDRGATTTNSIHLDSDSAQLQFGDANNMQIFHNSAKGEINVAAGDFEIDSAGDIILDAEGNDILFKDAGSTFGKITNNSQDLEIHASTNDKDIVFKGFDNGAGITAMTIDMSEGGNVGIGTNAPTARLEVSGSNTFRGTSAFYGSTTNELKALAFQFDSSYQGASNVLRFRQGGSTAGGVAFSLYDNVPSLFLTYSSTNPRVGIGTASPGATLDLRGDMRLDSAGNTDRSIYFRNQSSQGKIRSDAALQFDVGVSSSPSVAMYIQEDTRTVGIGTTNPRSGSLHIYNTNSVSDGDGSASMNPTGQDSIVLFTNGSENNNFGSISWLDGGRRRAMIAAASENSDGDYQGLSFFTQGTDGPGDLFESMRITRGGDVGIGTTSVNAGVGLQVANGSLYVTNGTAYLRHLEAQYFGSATELKLSAGQSADLKLMHYNTVDVTVKSDGKVGIGTTGPSGVLDVGGDGADIFLHSNDYKIARIQPRGTSADLDKGLFSLFSTTTEAVRIDSAGSSWFNGGSVGIGTDNPQSYLDVKTQIRVRDSNSDSTHVLLDSNASEGRLRLNNGSNWGLIARGQANNPYLGAYEGGSLNIVGFSTSDGANIAHTLAKFDFGNQRVGIGTTNPTESLEVTGDIFINGGPAGGRSLALKRTGATNAWKLTQGHTQTDYLEILEGSHTRFLIKNGGNVGIGSASPATQLDVSGIATASALRAREGNINYNLITRNDAAYSLYVQASQSNSQQQIASFRYGDGAAGQGTEVLSVKRGKLLQ